MPRMNILNAVEQEAFESAPVFNSFQRRNPTPKIDPLKRSKIWGLRNRVMCFSHRVL